MSGATFRSQGGGTGRRGKAGCLAIVLTVAASPPPADAAAISSTGARLMTLHRGYTPIAADKLALSVKDIEVEGGTDAPIDISLPSYSELRGAGADQGTFLLIRNVPDGVSVSVGMAAGRVWVVPLREIQAMRLQYKPVAPPSFQLEFRLIGPNKQVLAETSMSVTLQPARTLAQSSPEPEAKALAVQPEPEPLSAQAEAVLLKRGKALLDQGGIASARVIFAEVAAGGSAAGALALARSYDPDYMPMPRAVALAPAPNLAEARKWYERAAELGNPDARSRLADLTR